MPERRSLEGPKGEQVRGDVISVASSQPSPVREDENSKKSKVEQPLKEAVLGPEKLSNSEVLTNASYRSSRASCRRAASLEESQDDNLGQKSKKCTVSDQQGKGVEESNHEITLRTTSCPPTEWPSSCEFPTREENCTPDSKKIKSGFLLQVLFLGLGVAHLFSFNCLMLLLQFLQKEIFVGSNYLFLFSFVYALPLTLGGVCFTFLQQREAHWLNCERNSRLPFYLSFKFRWAVGCFGMALSCWGIALAVCVKSVYLAYVCVAVFGLSTAFFSGAAYGLASALNSSPIMVAISAGNGVAGILAVLLGPIPLSQPTAYVFLSFCGVVSFLCYVLYDVVFLRKDALRAIIQDLEKGEASRVNGSNHGEAPRAYFPDLVKEFWPVPLTLWYNFTVTFAVFPAVCLLWSDGGLASYFVMVLLGLFNVGDLMGRSLPNYYVMQGRRAIYVLAMLRTGFIPLFIWLQQQSADLLWLKMPTMVLFAVSHGYTATSVFIKGPAMFSNIKEQEIAGSTLPFLVVCGITSGSGVGLLLEYIFQM